jgi:hypothetical protein
MLKLSTEVVGIPLLNGVVGGEKAGALAPTNYCSISRIDIK